MQVCPNCGRQSRAEDQYCMHCGHRLGPPPAGGPGALAVEHTIPAGANGSVPAQAWTDPSVGRMLLQPQADGEPMREFALDGRNVTIGRAPACTVSLPDDPMVSRLHAVVHYDADHYTISDLGSSNGTLVNGVAIQAVTPLTEGDRITVGQHVLIFTQTPARPATPPAAVEAAGMPAPHDPPLLPPMPEVPEWETLLAQNDDAQLPEGSDGASAFAPQQTLDTDEAVGVVDTAALGDALVMGVAGSEPTGEEAASTPPPADCVSTAGAGDPAVQTGPRTGQLEELRAQIVETSTVLARWTETTAQNTKRLRAGLADVAGIVAAALTAATGDAPVAQAQGTESALRRIKDLIEVTEHAANNPQHVNALVALAGRSGDIVTALRIQQHLIEQLALLRDRLDAMARQEGW